MATRLSSRAKTLTAKLRLLRKRAHVEVMDAFFDEVFSRLGELKSVSCNLADDSSICLQSHGEPGTQVKLPRTRSMLRMMCARLAVRCSEWAQKEVSPYGDDVEFEHPAIRKQCRVWFENTTDRQWFEISDATV